ncbi:MAG: winged helix-turn-helix transcriptional regulator [Ornithinibacter sp.]
MTRDGWTFLTNHGHVLVCLAADPEVLVRDVAASIGITERAVQQIIGDLERAGVVVRARVGRRNHYLVSGEQRLRHAVESGVTVGQLVDLVQQGGSGSKPPQPVRLLATGSGEPSAEDAGDWASAGHEVVAHLRSQGL